MDICDTRAGEGGVVCGLRGGAGLADYSSAVVVVIVFAGAVTHRHYLLVRCHKAGSNYF